jgi:uncharacterized protein (DUF2249 family)/hemerythrin-like domain-containing protein
MRHALRGAKEKNFVSQQLNVAELDVRTIPPGKRHPEILRRFDALSPDEGFVLVNDHDPKPLLYLFQNERPRSFEWSVLEAGPERFRIELRRRREATPRNVTEFLGWDHARLDQIFSAVERNAQSGDFFDASARFAEFRCGLERHIDIEQEVLFPVFEQQQKMTCGPTQVMRHEHAAIKSLLKGIASALADEDTSGFVGFAADLQQVLSGHNMKEEGILYPMTDGALTDERDRDALVRRMQAF